MASRAQDLLHSATAIVLRPNTGTLVAMRHAVFRGLVWATLLASSALHAETTVHRLTLKEAAAHALEKSPAVGTAASKEAGAEAKVGLAESEAVPKVALVGQVTRSTDNVVPGATFAMPGIPGVQGPPGESRLGTGVWQSSVGVTATWDVLDLVRRPAIVGVAGKEVSLAKAQSTVTRLLVLAQVADTYLVVVEAHALQRAADASAKRTQTFHNVVATLVAQKLRPDLDLARADTEIAAARVLVEKTKLGVTVTHAKLSQAIGETEWAIEVVESEFAELPAMPESPKAPHPAVVAHEDVAKLAEARAAVAKLTMLPKVELAGAAWLRGGGYVIGGGPNSAAGGGLLPDTPNWAVGVVVTWAPTDIPSANAKMKIENAEASLAKARAIEAQTELATEVKVARATLTSFLAVAKETTSAVAAARRAAELANTRYLTGNGSVLEVVEAERALTTAERDDAIARLEAWRALVAVHRAQGDLQPLLGAAAKAKGSSSARSVAPSR